MGDYYVDLENGLKPSFLPILEANPRIPKDAFLTGWEECTSNGSASILDSMGRTGHENNVGAASPYAKLCQTDHIFCNATVSAAVFERYREDYALMERVGLPYKTPHRCCADK